MLKFLLRNSTKAWNSGLSMKEKARKLVPISSSRSRSNFCWRGPTGSTLAGLTKQSFKVVWPGSSLGFFWSLPSFLVVSSSFKSCHSVLCLLSRWLLRDFVLPPESLYLTSCPYERQILHRAFLPSSESSKYFQITALEPERFTEDMIPQRLVIQN